MPLWSSYLVKVYAWRIILPEDGILNWALDPFGLPGPGFGNVATWLVFSYLWLPFMILPVYAGLERIPDSLLEASGDLGARAGATFRRVVLPLALPAVVAGSIFTFSLTLGDYITPQLVSEHAVHRQRRLRERRRGEQPAARRRVRDGAGHRHDPLPARRAAARRVRHRCDASRPAARLVAAGRDRRSRWRSSTCRCSSIVAVRVQRAPHARRGRSRASRSTGSARRSTTPASRDALLDVAQGGARRDRDRARARHARLVRGRALPLLRPRDDLVPRRSCRSRCRASSPAWR